MNDGVAYLRSVFGCDAVCSHSGQKISSSNTLNKL